MGWWLWPLLSVLCVFQLHSGGGSVRLGFWIGIGFGTWMHARFVCSTFGFVIKIFSVLFRFCRSPYHNVLCARRLLPFSPCERTYFIFLFFFALLCFLYIFWFFCEPTFWRFPVLISGNADEFNYAAARVFLSRLTFCLMINNNAAVFQRQPGAVRIRRMRR